MSDIKLYVGDSLYNNYMKLEIKYNFVVLVIYKSISKISIGVSAETAGILLDLPLYSYTRS